MRPGRRSPGRRSPAGLLAWLVAAVVAIAACATPDPTGSPGSSDPSAAPSPTTAAASPGQSGSSDPSVDAGVPVDPTLLDVAPEEVDGIAVTFDPVTSAELARGTGLVGDIVGIATALAIAGVDDLAIVNVVRPRDGLFGDEWFRDWRDTYDEGVCGQAGGVVGKAEAELGGRTVHIGSCEGGVLTYHAHLPGAGVIVSITALGPRRLGEQIAALLQE